MKDEIFIKGRKYITTKSASELTGYTSDYVEQLSRAGKIKTMMIGHTRYVDEKDILNYGDSGGILIEDKKYISTKRASELTGYASDYIGQLSRGGAIKSSLIGKTKFVEEIEILEYAKKSGKMILQKGDFEQDLSAQAIDETLKEKPQKDFIKTEWANYFKDDSPLIPSLKKEKSFPASKKEKIISPFEKPASFVSDAIFKKVVALCLAIVVVFGPYVFSRTPYVEAAQEKLKSLASNVFEIGEEIAGKVNKDGVIVLLTDSVSYTKDLLKNETKKIAVNTASAILSANIQDTKFSAKDIAKAIYVSINSFFKKNKTGEDTRLVKEAEDNNLPAQTEKEQTQIQPESQPPKTIVIEGPTKIIERITEITSSTAISKEELEIRIQQLDNKLSAKIYDVYSGTSNSVQSIYQVVSQTNKIDKLTNVDIITPAITGGTLKNSIITGSTFSGTTLDGSVLTLTGNATIGGQLTVSGTATSTLAGDVNFDSNTLYIDSLNNRIGIGTTTPQYALDVVGNINATGIITATSQVIGGDLSVTGNTTLGNATTTDITYFNSRIGSSLIPTADNILDLGDSANWLRWKSGFFGTSIGIGGNATTTGSSLLSSGAYAIDSNGTLSINTTNNQPTTFGTGLVTLPNLSGTNATITNATTTNFYSTLANIITGIFSSLTATTFTATNSTTTNATSTTLAITNTATTSNLIISNDTTISSLTPSRLVSLNSS
ncbi:hypothetical protein KJ991_01290, partial [Patescibacteria group bacterium]|nr:hypothetical protein [Patescibacteria group bacterium]MBU4057757.1 hypothetical protein [Patescibacteria group bacterium]MBU4115934.1 hypothetical protein [Patescibacteria group bacterium]